MECCYTRPGHQGTPFVAMSRFFYECLHKPKRTKRNNHCAIGTLANLGTFSQVFFLKQSLLLVVVSGSNQHVPGHMSCRDLSGHHPNMQAARALAALACYMLQLLTAQLSSQRFYLRPNQISCAGQMKFATRCLKIQFSLLFLGEVLHLV